MAGLRIPKSLIAWLKITVAYSQHIDATTIETSIQLSATTTTELSDKHCDK